ncbi:DUF2274 domain-containing protein [Litoreibacter roseus]|uniref:DUF2274 domain-containing protein n=1 Tax=Litoreibacter roseus TaxID=2601869 RepID=A0A6N6JMQ9_9RHOB|nr:DUF2274 domain-containing protein [Litoreibacter roseus]GFE66588.1 hypothetical protein KIN_36620 [Litoreibacter roseus]
MTKLKLGNIRNDKPVKLNVELPAHVHRDLTAYAEILGAENGETLEPAKLVAPMLERFMKTDRGFSKLRKDHRSSSPRSAQER